MLGKKNVIVCSLGATEGRKSDTLFDLQQKGVRL